MTLDERVQEIIDSEPFKSLVRATVYLEKTRVASGTAEDKAEYKSVLHTVWRARMREIVAMSDNMLVMSGAVPSSWVGEDSSDEVPRFATPEEAVRYIEEASGMSDLARGVQSSYIDILKQEAQERLRRHNEVFGVQPKQPEPVAEADPVKPEDEEHRRSEASETVEPKSEVDEPVNTSGMDGKAKGTARGYSNAKAKEKDDEPVSNEHLIPLKDRVQLSREQIIYILSHLAAHPRGYRALQEPCENVPPRAVFLVETFMGDRIKAIQLARGTGNAQKLGGTIASSTRKYPLGAFVCENGIDKVRAW